jgi:hypothetical protein
MVILSGECGEMLSNKGPPAFQAMTSYLNAGGRLFGVASEYTWFKYSPDPAVSTAVKIPPMFLPDDSRLAANPVYVDATFPKGKALADWLKQVSPMEPYGEINPLHAFRIAQSVSPPAQVWARSHPADIDDNPLNELPLEPRIYSLNMPAGAPLDQQCGKTVHLDMRVNEGLPLTFYKFPDDCGTDFFPGEQVLAFLMFDLASCIQDDGQPPPPR